MSRILTDFFPRALIEAELADFERGQGYKLTRTPANEPSIPLVALASGRIICQFNKVELAMLLGHDSATCPHCRTSLQLVSR